MANPLSNPAGNVVPRWVYQAILVEMTDKTLYGLRANQRHKQVEAQLDCGPGSKMGGGKKIGVTWSQKRSFKWRRPNSYIYSQNYHFGLVYDMIYQFLGMEAKNLFWIKIVVWNYLQTDSVIILAIPFAVFVNCISIGKTPVKIILWCPITKMLIKACFLVQPLEQEGVYQKCCISMCSKVFINYFYQMKASPECLNILTYCSKYWVDRLRRTIGRKV